MNKDVNTILNNLSKSKFRSSFHLNKNMKDYCRKKGKNKIIDDAYYFINNRLRPSMIKNDGKQTPMRQVHPVFIAQHACACCCRSCLYKWYHIEKERELSDKEINFIVSLLIKWIEKELSVK